MEGIEKAIERGALAGKLRAAAMEHRTTAEALERAADKFSRGVAGALATIEVETAPAVRRSAVSSGGDQPPRMRRHTRGSFGA